MKWQSRTSKSLWPSSSVGTTKLCHGEDAVQSKVSLLLPQEGWLEGVKLEGKCPPCTSWSSVKRPHKEKHPLIAISCSALTRA